MNLLCPNCQKMLTVPEQYAGQLMKCPLCAGTFTVPALPPSPSLSEQAPKEPPPSAPPPQPGFPPLGPPSPPSFPEPDTYGLSQEEHVSTPLPPAPLPPSPSAPAGSTPAPTLPAPPPSPPSKSAGPPAGYTRTESLHFNPKVLQWIAPAGVLLIFIFQFFTWVEIAPGGVPAFRQGAWSAAFGAGDTNYNLPSFVFYNHLMGKTEVSDPKEVKKPLVEEKDVKASVLAIFYLLVFIPTLILTLAVIVLLFVKLPPLPPAVQKLLPYRWGIVTVLNLLAFFFLVLQMVLGFSVETEWAAKVNKDLPALKSGTTQELDVNEALRGILLEYPKKTAWLWLVFILHILTIVAAALMYWINQRGESRPLPKIELVT